MSNLSIILQAMQDGQKIVAIKALREATELGLKEAKDIIDAAWNDRNAPNAGLIVASLVEQRGRRIHPGSPDDPFEATSEMLWRLSDLLVETSDERAESVKFLAQELDEIWGVV